MFILMFVRLKSCCIFARLKKEYYVSLEIMKRTFQPSRRKRRKREAQQLLTEAKKLDKHGMLKGQMKMIQQQMKKI